MRQKHPGDIWKQFWQLVVNIIILFVTEYMYLKYYFETITVLVAILPPKTGNINNTQ